MGSRSKIVVAVFVVLLATMITKAIGKDVVRDGNLERKAYGIEIIRPIGDPYYLPVWNGEYPGGIGVSSALVKAANSDDVQGCVILIAKISPATDADYIWDYQPKEEGVLFQPAGENATFCSKNEGGYIIRVSMKKDQLNSGEATKEVKTRSLHIKRDCTCNPPDDDANGGHNEVPVAISEHFQIDFNDMTITAQWSKSGDGVNEPKFIESPIGDFTAINKTVNTPTIITAKIIGQGSETWEKIITKVIGPERQDDSGIAALD